MYDYISINKNPSKYAQKITIDELVKLLEILSDAYYGTGEPIVSDEIFDELYDILKKRDPTNIYLKKVGGPEKGTKELVELPFEMGSLIKIKPGNEDLNKWISKYKGQYNLSDKLDGVSGQIYKNQSGKIFMYSRGDGVEGQNISHLLKYIISPKALELIPNGTSIRGELIISKKNFKKIEDRMKNARNAVAGLVNAKNFDKDIANITEFVAYSILNPRYLHHDQIKLLTKWKFNVVINKFVDKLKEDILKLYLVERREKSEYEIDGIVCVDDSKIYPHEEGYPEHAFAFKMLMQDQIRETRVIEILWKPSKDGLLKPTIVVEPVNITGVTIKKATAFNAKFISDNEIGPGAKIKIVRSGDVIPYILEVTKGSKNGPQMPKFKYKWNSTGVDIILQNENNTNGDNNGTEMVKVQLLIHFFSTMGIKYMSDGILNNLAINGYDTVNKILVAKKKDLIKIDGLGEKIIDKIYKEIDRAFENVSLEVFMSASNKLGRNLGTRKIKEIINKYPNILVEAENADEDELYEKIIEVPGFSDKLSKQFCDNFDKFMKFYKEISKLKDLSRFENIIIENIEGIFSDKSIVFTGFRDLSLEKFIIENGGKINNSVSSNTYILIHKDDADTSTNKFIKAKEKGVKIIKKSDFIKKYIKSAIKIK
jgi:DNA ligase (NAD+)